MEWANPLPTPEKTHSRGSEIPRELDFWPAIGLIRGEFIWVNVLIWFQDIEPPMILNCQTSLNGI